MKRGRFLTWGLAAVLCLATPVFAEGVQVIEDFESYDDNLTGWTVFNQSNITLSLGLTKLIPLEPLEPINGTRDMSVTLGAAVLPSTYTVGSNAFDVTVPVAAQSFKFKLRPLLAVNLVRNVRVRLRGDGGSSFESKPISLALLSLNAISDLDFKLSEFTPPVSSASLPAVKGVDLVFTSSLATIAAEEHIDDLRLTWDNSNVSDWMCY